MTATANGGYTFANWTENGTVQSTSPNYSFTLAANCNLIANFAANPVTYTVTSSAGKNGSISPNGPEAVTAGGNITFNAAPAGDYQVNQWLVNGTVVQTGGSVYTLQNVITNNAVVVTFSADPVVATNSSQNTVTNGGQNTVTNGGQNTVTNGGQNTVTNSGQNTVTNSGQNTVTNSGQNTVTNANTNFTLLINGNGTLAPSRTAKALKAGKKYTLTATAAKGSVFADWISNGIVVATTPKVHFLGGVQCGVAGQFHTQSLHPRRGHLPRSVLRHQRRGGRKFRLLCCHRDKNRGL